MPPISYPQSQFQSTSSLSMAGKMPEYYSCEICGAEGMTEGGMREHVMMRHVVNAASCPFCDLSQTSESELITHVNTAHLEYLSPESERDVLAFIDDDDMSPRDVCSNSQRPRLHKENINNNNNNNNVEFFEDRIKNGESWGSPQRSQLALNLRPQSSSLRCPLCAFSHHDAAKLEQHINRQHFDLTSPSLPAESPTTSLSESIYSCPLCVRTFENTPDLELHVNIEHKDILSPANLGQETAQEKGVGICPICCLGSFKTTDELANHIEEHFSQKGLSPMTPDVSADRLLAKEMEKRDKEIQRLREQHEFQMLRAQYGMDNEGNFKEQSLTNMQRAVYSGELSVADYYERQVELKMAESTGVDDSSSCTRDIVPLVTAASSSASNVMRVHLCTTVDHYASTYGDRGWGCGYRNMQMMLSSLFHHTGYNEALYRQWSLVGGRMGSMPPRSAMPSISRLQGCIEWAWSQGFDTQGSEQLGGCLTNTRKWIGATEVITVLSSHRIRCQLVDFHRPTSPNGSHPELFTWALNYFQSQLEFKPPLYLQHQGHSRTIIGVEELRDGGLNLLVLDPSHSPQQIGELRCTLTSCNAMRLIRKGYGAMKAKQYQVVAVIGLMESELEYQRSKILTTQRIPKDR